MSEPTPILHLSFDETPPQQFRGGAVAVGNFDGVHLGHSSLIRKLVEQARAVQGPAVVLSFDPHPLMLLAPERFQPVLTEPAQRAVLLQKCGADAVVHLRTTPDLLRLTPEEFFHKILHGAFAAKAIVEGFNFRFGRDRAGSLDTLAQLCQSTNIRFEIVPPLELDGTPVSSSRVRDALLAGDAQRAERLLGRPYSLRGEVLAGAKRGRTLGFPTANLERINTLIPGNGVYAVRSEFDGQSFAGAANIGPNPTFGEHARKVEVHLLDFQGDLYGRTLGVTFLEKLRDVRRFSSKDDLIQQLQWDIECVRKTT